MKKNIKIKLVLLGAFITLISLICLMYNKNPKYDNFFKILLAIGVSMFIALSTVKPIDEQPSI